ncbi:MAG TPA: hypothetical protein VN793_08745, partial [Acidimicrobiales bacterium]|nr:hypothetical protein [Acidimicrobiales bacterium]
DPPAVRRDEPVGDSPVDPPGVSPADLDRAVRWGQAAPEVAAAPGSAAEDVRRRVGPGAGDATSRSSSRRS